MTLEEAIALLEIYNKWRRDTTGTIEFSSSKEIGIAIDVVVTDYHVKNKREPDKMGNLEKDVENTFGSTLCLVLLISLIILVFP